MSIQPQTGQVRLVLRGSTATTLTPAWSVLYSMKPLSCAKAQDLKSEFVSGLVGKSRLSDVVTGSIELLHRLQEGYGLFLSRIEFDNRSQLHWPACSSMYRWIVSAETLPAVEQKYERVQRLGKRISDGNSLRSKRDERPLKRRTMSWAGTVGLACTNKCTWSGMMARCSIFQPFSAATSWSIWDRRSATAPRKTALRRFGHQIRWYSIR